MSKRNIISLIISILFVLTIIFRPIWERNPGGLWTALFFLLIAILFFWLITKIIIEIVYLIRQRKVLKIKSFIPIVVMIVLLFDGMYNPFKIDLNKLYGDVIFRACYEGTQNQATFKLLENDKFELHWTGAFFYDEFFIGTYVKKNDTLFLDYKWEKPVRFGDKIFMNNEYEILETVRKEGDSLVNVVPFYYGYCKGLN